MLNDYFRETMDAFNIKGAQLARRAGCSHNNISEIRNGKVSPPISRFWELIEMCEEIAPGFKGEFGRRVSGGLSFKAERSINSNVMSQNSFVFQLNGDAKEISHQLQHIPPQAFEEILKAIVLKVSTEYSTNPTYVGANN